MTFHLKGIGCPEYKSLEPGNPSHYINGTWTGVIGNVFYNVKLLTLHFI